jgi:hypothetical protein
MIVLYKILCFLENKNIVIFLSPSFITHLIEVLQINIKENHGVERIMPF